MSLNMTPRAGKLGTSRMRARQCSSRSRAPSDTKGFRPGGSARWAAPPLGRVIGSAEMRLVRRGEGSRFERGVPRVAIVVAPFRLVIRGRSPKKVD